LGLDEFTWGRTKYAYDDADISNVAEDAATAIKDMEGRNVTSSITLGVDRDSKDRPWNTTTGSLNSLSYEYAGGFLGGDVGFDKILATSAWYFPFRWNTVFLARGRWGYVKQKSGEKLPSYQKFRLGGINTVRGYDFGSISPRDPETGDRIGGEKMMCYTLEYRFPVIKEQGVVGLVFFDAGNVYTKDESWSHKDLRKSVGGGIRWYSPIGPLRLEYGYKLDREEDESSGEFEFSVGGIF
jgi:outer membrane protein insertion porin family